MTTFLIVLGVIIGIIVILCTIIRAIVNNNPVDSITPYGTYGFRIGASQKTVISKIKRLKLASKEELEEFEDDVEFQREINGEKFGLTLYFECAEYQFGHIKNLCFVFKNNKLAQLTILFDKSPEEIPEFMEIVEYRVSKQLGKPSFKGENIVKWRNDISLYASLDEVEDTDKVLKLYIGLTNVYGKGSSMESEQEARHIHVKKLKNHLGITALVLAISYIIILWQHQWSFNLFFANSVVTVLSTLILLICIKKPSLTKAFLGLCIGAIIYSYGLTLLVKNTCHHVTIVNKDRSRTERFYLPINDYFGKNRLPVVGGHSYILNNTGKTLYLTKVTYGNYATEENNKSQLKNGEAVPRKNLGQIRWFYEQEEKKNIKKRTKQKTVTFISFRSIE